MNTEELNFDDFMSYDSKTRKMILNSPELIKIMLKNLPEDASLFLSTHQISETEQILDEK